jgi:Rha family phage regulatory protein
MTDLQLLPHEAERNPIVFARDGEIFANSRDVAAYFGKEHRSVLASIDKLLSQDADLGLHDFMQGSYTLIGTGEQEHRCFDMTRDGFTLLAMGFTGAKALGWKRSYIRAFNVMEDQLRRPAVIDFSDPKVALGFIEHLSGKVKEQEAVIVEQGGRLKKLDRIEAAGGSMCLTDAAKTLKVGPQELIRFMQARGFIYKRVGNASWIGRQEKITVGYLEHREHVYIDKDGHARVATRALVTGKGLVRLAELLNEPTH